MIIDFDKFKKTTGYNVEQFFVDFSTFVSSQYQLIVDYYTGGDLDKDSFFELDRLTSESKKIEPLFNLNKGKLNTVDMWELLDVFSDIQVKLMTISNMGKWSRSSRLGVQSQNVKIDRILNQNETLEKVAKDLGYSSSQDAWKDIAINNYITEEDYTSEGGTLFTISLQNNFNFDIPNIVDLSSANNVYGKDISRKIQFDSVTNDLVLVENKDNLNQNFKIKLETVKGYIPEFPEDGLDGQLIGTNISAVQYPTLIRNIVSLFKKDARWREVNIVDIHRDSDAVFLKIEAKSILKDSYITNINI